MPTYEYQCDACGHAFEQFQSITARPTRTCPICRKRRVRRLIGRGAGIIFKGSGFYQTDYRSDGYKQAAAAEKPAADKSTADKPAAGADKSAGGAVGKTASAKSDAKPAGKAAG